MQVFLGDLGLLFERLYLFFEFAEYIRNTDKIRTFLESRQADLGKSFDIRTETARSDSMSIYKEVMNVRGTDMIVWTASRDYGLDDLIFGPAERKLILRSVVPIALLNPRGDLFSLCD